MKYYLRSELAKKANINIETLRFYENNNLIPIPERNENGYRMYSEETFLILDIIKTAKSAGFTLNQIKNLFSSSKSIDDITKALQEKVEEIENKIEELNNIKNTIQEFDILLKNKGCTHIDNFLMKNK